MMTDQADAQAVQLLQSPFERIKRIDPEGNEFWTGRDVMDVLGYANWLRISPAYQEVYSSLCLDNPQQSEMTPSSMKVEIGSGALREIPDWRLSGVALDRMLSRVASHKPEAVRELRRRNDKFRIEIEIGATLFDFCEQADLPISHQFHLEN